MFPNVAQMLEILATLPIASVEVERLFSKMEQTLTAIRATMHEARLEALLLLNVHRQLSPSTDEIINSFANSRARKLRFKL